MDGWIEVLNDLGAAWLNWAGSFILDAAQLPYRVALTAFMVGAIMSWFAAREWYRPVIKTRKNLHARRFRPVRRNAGMDDVMTPTMPGREVGV